MAAIDFSISLGPYTALITQRGGALRSLRHRGRDLVVGFGADGPIPDYRGVICAPWPNRLADGRYSYARQDYTAPVNEPERGSALHGLATDRVWEVLAANGSEVTLGCRIEPGPALPSQLDLTATYALSADGLHSSVTAVNTGNAAAPYGVCPHPYLVAGPHRWTSGPSKFRRGSSLR